VLIRLQLSCWPAYSFFEDASVFMTWSVCTHTNRRATGSLPIVWCLCIGLLGVLSGVQAQDASAQDGASAVRADTTRAEEDPASRADRWRQRRKEKSVRLHRPEAGVLKKVDRFFVNTAVSVIPNELILDLPKLRVAGIRPLIGNASGGFTAGAMFKPDHLQTDRRLFHVKAVGGPSRYHAGEAILGIESETFVSYGYARYRHEPSEDFFGIGPDSEASDQSTFRWKEGLFGGLGARPIGEKVLLGGHVSYQLNRIGEGRGNLTSAQDRFGEELPGTGNGTDYAMVGAFFEYDSRNTSSEQAFGHRFAPTEHRLRSVSLEASQGFYLSGEVTHNASIHSDQFGFTRYTLDAREFIPIDEGQFHGFSFRQFASFTQSGSEEVPFYRLQSIGGSRSLRGFENDRFRDRNVVLMNTEVRCQVWHHLDMALFADAGHVFADAESFGDGGVRVGYGVGFRVRSSEKTLGRVDIARSTEGWQVTLDVGSLF